jgi:hypothetical protein
MSHVLFIYNLCKYVKFIIYYESVVKQSLKLQDHMSFCGLVHAMQSQWPTPQVFSFMRPHTTRCTHCLARYFSHNRPVVVLHTLLLTTTTTVSMEAARNASIDMGIKSTMGTGKKDLQKNENGFEGGYGALVQLFNKHEHV